MTHSFPTRRSAELGARRGRRPGQGLKAARGEEDMRQHLASGHSAARCLAGIFLALICLLPASCTDSRDTITVGSKNFGERSEEHTSELQSLMRISYAVFYLKKKKTNINLYL